VLLTARPLSGSEPPVPGVSGAAEGREGGNRMLSDDPYRMEIFSSSVTILQTASMDASSPDRGTVSNWRAYKSAIVVFITSLGPK